MQEFKKAVDFLLKKVQETDTPEKAMAWSQSVSNLMSISHSGCEMYAENLLEAEDLVDAFLEECCSVNEDNMVSSTDLYAAISEWWYGNVSKRVPGAKWFGKKLARRYEKIKTERGVCYKGIALS